MISNNKHTLLFWTWLTLVACDSFDQRKHLTNELYKSVFSEKEIFFNPANKEPVPLLSLSSSTKIRGPKGVYGWLPCFCGPEVCSCCVDIRIKSLNSEDSGCVMVSPTHDNSSMNAEILLNNKTMVQERLSFENAPPLCVPFPPFPAISLCVRLNEIMRDGRNVKACINFELRITGTLNPLWTLQFTCVRFGLSGISFFRPSTTTSAPPDEEEVVLLYPQPPPEGYQLLYLGQPLLPPPNLI